MSISETSPIYRLSRQILNRIVPGALILMYHRVSSQVDLDPWKLVVTPQHFAEHMEVIRRYTRPMPLQTLNQQVQAGKRMPKAVVVTFDDGYADNLLYARPILERQEIPATVFIVSGYVGEEQEYWWDELEKLMLFPGRLPETLTLMVNEKAYRWELGETAEYTRVDYERFRSWDANWQAPPTPRHQIFLTLHSILRPLLPGEREELLGRLWEWAGTTSIVRQSHRTLKAEELLRLVDGDLVEAGAHTVTHPLLSALPAELQRDEIERSKSQLEELIGFPVNTFSYPYGNYNSATLQIVKEAGFNCACSTIVDGIWFKAHPFLLPRLEVRNWDGEEFFRRLHHWSWA